MKRELDETACEEKEERYSSGKSWDIVDVP